MASSKRNSSSRGSAALETEQHKRQCALRLLSLLLLEKPLKALQNL
jgi:hypothetical protein